MPDCSGSGAGAGGDSPLTPPNISNLNAGGDSEMGIGLLDKKISASLDGSGGGGNGVLEKS